MWYDIEIKSSKIGLMSIRDVFTYLTIYSEISLNRTVKQEVI
jgi:hypothetical protein